MRTRLLVAAIALLCASPMLSAQGKAEGKTQSSMSYSIEAGTGIQPLQMLLAGDRAVREALAPKGQDIDSQGGFYPVINLTGVIRSGHRTEFTLTAGASWYHHKVIQYPVFGTDPEGRPRYDLKNGTPAGWKDSIPTYSLTLQWRHLWNPDNDFTVYTALGAGVVTRRSFGFVPLPSLTPVAFRYGGKHFYAFAELTLGTLASIAHGGLGWHF